MTNKNAESNWQHKNIQIFWGEIAPCDHLVQIYENNKIFLDTLEGFVGTGFLAGESVIVIAIPDHLDELNERLKKQGFDLDQLITNGSYIPLDAEETLSRFMLNGWPDDKLFNDVITELLVQAGNGKRKIRAFGEMVAILWSKGLNGATVRLENLWNRLQSDKDFTLYCAYPKSGFTQNVTDSIHTICQAHSKLIDGNARPATEIYYKSSSK